MGLSWTRGPFGAGPWTAGLKASSGIQVDVGPVGREAEVIY